jgi:hypothetical protein
MIVRARASDDAGCRLVLRAGPAKGFRQVSMPLDFILGFSRRLEINQPGCEDIDLAGRGNFSFRRMTIRSIWTNMHIGVCIELPSETSRLQRGFITAPFRGL